MLNGQPGIRRNVLNNAVSPDENDPNESLLIKEVTLLNTMMGLSSKLFMVSENNAFANPRDMNVYFGRPMIQHLKTMIPKIQKDIPDLKNYQGALQAAIRLVLAHEFAHIYQFKTWSMNQDQVSASTPHIETQADCLAGLWIGFDFTKDGGRMAEVAAAIAYKIGDTAWDSPDHHGSPDTRRMCFVYGLRKGGEQAFGSRESAYKAKGPELFNWSRSIASQILTT
jgi:hypothetical protein